ncbi:GNAT family N-acetyltransferase [Aureibacter tunicatorum]|uniref:RimJ/RimL family protein N-acetyltransferase n=1 Tax=Aureibacter tunicatorum TaxID=866807 RepID=A0AAE3XPD5_9BACT|nr:GNAT family N-acetyltransferase [Aureibacter tunicatorum]MDR6240677.1 RimJ/RimL family protein N-acetyltransferase [Aureibacter tunicatorum]BDD06990.1 hypothetical protein AUTU_44730 [Aureibacter tunicatorum]
MFLNDFSTQRFCLEELSESDFEFVYELVNTAGWIEFIGDKGVRSFEDAREYAKKMSDAPNIEWWNIKMVDTGCLAGVITFIKRDFLDHYDIGFALLPEFEGKGIAFEASKLVMDQAFGSGEHDVILGRTMKKNSKSINLLEKLGLKLLKESEDDKGVVNCVLKVEKEEYYSLMTQD